MDILKIRKRGRRPEKEKPVTTTTTAPAAPAPAAPARATPPPAAKPPVAKPPVAKPKVPQAAKPADNKGDPLEDFLARYDLEEGHFATQLPDTELDRPRYLAFALEGEEYAVSIMDVREILRVVALTEVPRAPHQILGVLSKRGIVMPIIDLGATLGLRPPKLELDMRQRVLVVGDGPRVAGLRVDDLHEVVEFESGEIEEVPASLGARTVHFLRGLGRNEDRMYILLDVEAVLDALSQTTGADDNAVMV